MTDSSDRVGAGPHARPDDPPADAPTPDGVAAHAPARVDADAAALNVVGADGSVSPRTAIGLRELAFVTTVLATVGLDQWTKSLARQHLLVDGLPRSVPVLGDWLRFSYVENRGAAFGLFQNQTLFFVIVGLVVIGVIVASYRQMARPNWLVNLCLGLQMGGAIGNLIDRVSAGYVVDFVDFGYQANWWPVFNVADSAIVLGVAGLAYSMLFAKSHTEHHAEPQD